MFPSALPYKGNEAYWDEICVPMYEPWWKANMDEIQNIITEHNVMVEKCESIYNGYMDGLAKCDENV